MTKNIKGEGLETGGSEGLRTVCLGFLGKLFTMLEGLDIGWNVSFL